MIGTWEKSLTRRARWPGRGRPGQGRRWEGASGQKLERLEPADHHTNVDGGNQHGSNLAPMMGYQVETQMWCKYKYETYRALQILHHVVVRRVICIVEQICKRKDPSLVHLTCIPDGPIFQDDIFTLPIKIFDSPNGIHKHAPSKMIFNWELGSNKERKQDCWQGFYTSMFQQNSLSDFLVEILKKMVKTEMVCAPPKLIIQLLRIVMNPSS